MPIQIKKTKAGVYKVSKPYGNDIDGKMMSAAKVNPSNSSMPAKKVSVKKVKKYASKSY
jgi:tRNA G10  N-methylase Trm11